MGQLADRLDNIKVHVRAPGTEIGAVLRHRGDISLSFGESVYDFIGEPALESSLSTIARLLWNGWLRQYRAAIDGTSLNIDPDDQHDLNFIAERAEITTVGMSSDERVTISAVGMENFSVRVRPGTVREISEDEFASDATEAATKLIQDYRDQVNELKTRYYG